VLADSGHGSRVSFHYEDVVDEETELHDGDWDVLITEAFWLGRSPSLFTIAFDVRGLSDVQVWHPEDEQTAEMRATGHVVQIVQGGESPARDLEVPGGLSPDIERLVRSDLIPGFEAGEPKKVLRVQRWYGGDAIVQARTASPPNSDSGIAFGEFPPERPDLGGQRDHVRAGRRLSVLLDLTDLVE
jgi:hypothetical protein